MSNEANLTGASAGCGEIGNPLFDENEDLLTLTEATKIMPRINGRRPAVSTLWRWCRKGLHGVHLEYLRIGRNIVTSRRALRRFFADLAAADRQLDSDGPVNPVTRRNQQFLSQGGRSEHARQNSIEEAEAVLEEAGI